MKTHKFRLKCRSTSKLRNWPLLYSFHDLVDLPLNYNHKTHKTCHQLHCVWCTTTGALTIC